MDDLFENDPNIIAITVKAEMITHEDHIHGILRDTDGNILHECCCKGLNVEEHEIKKAIFILTINDYVEKLNRYNVHIN